MVQNKALMYRNVPTGLPVVGKDLTIEDIGFDLDQAPPKGGVTLKINYVSFDPYQRPRMRAPGNDTYNSPYVLNKPITNGAIATVLKSDSSKFKAGDIILGDTETATAEYVALTADKVEKARKIENPHGVNPWEFLGSLGMPGLTAYSSLYEIGKPKKGETIFVSAASGAVGQLVGLIAKREGLTVIGSVGDDAKLRYIIDELGFDSGFNYKKERPGDALKRLAPGGIDIYYENVGGEHMEAAINAMKIFGRIVACGTVSQYNTPLEEQYPIRNLSLVVGKRINMRGFIVWDADMGPKYLAEHNNNVQKWIQEGSYKPKTSLTKGIDNAAEGFIGLIQGKNFGKAVLEVSPL